MATQLVCDLREALEQAEDPVISRLDAPETAIPWPGQPVPFWPRADISGELATGERFIVKVDDQADPARSVVKYWPLLHAAQEHGFEFARICFVELSAPNSTFGRGYQLLARFIGERFEGRYPDRFRFAFVDLGEREVPALAATVLDRFRRGHESYDHR